MAKNPRKHPEPIRRHEQPAGELLAPDRGPQAADCVIYAPTKEPGAGLVDEQRSQAWRVLYL